MRIGAALFLLLVLSAVPGPSPRSGLEDSGGTDASRDRLPRGPYLLRQIFGDLPQSAPRLWGLAPGIHRSDVPAGADLGEEEKRAGSPSAFTKDVSGRATVTFVFDGAGLDAHLDHITVTVVQAPNITPRAMLTQLSRIYGPADSLPAGQAEIAGSWQNGAVLLRHFPAARFFEVTLASPRSPSVPSP